MAVLTKEHAQGTLGREPRQVKARYDATIIVPLMRTLETEGGLNYVASVKNLLLVRAQKRRIDENGFYTRVKLIRGPGAGTIWAKVFPRRRGR